MNLKFVSRSLMTLLALGSLVLGAKAARAEEKHPCEEIKKACETAGFKRGQAKDGTGLWVDCIDPIMQGKSQPEKAKIKLPTVDAQLIKDCKTKHENWGQGQKKAK